MIVGLFQKNPNRGDWGHTFFKIKPCIFEVCHFTLGNSGHNKAFFTLGNSVKLCYTPWKFQGQKPRLIKMQHDFFLIIPKNSTFILGNCKNCKNYSELGKTVLNNFWNLVELLWHRVSGWERKSEDHVQNAPWLSHLLLSQFRFFAWSFKTNYNID